MNYCKNRCYFLIFLKKEKLKKKNTNTEISKKKLKENIEFLKSLNYNIKVKSRIFLITQICKQLNLPVSKK